MNIRAGGDLAEFVFLPTGALLQHRLLKGSFLPRTAFASLSNHSGQLPVVPFCSNDLLTGILTETVLNLYISLRRNIGPGPSLQIHEHGASPLI